MVKEQNRWKQDKWTSTTWADTFVGTFVDACVGALVGSPRKAENRQNQPSWVLSWALSWVHSWATVSPLVEPLVGSRFAFGCSVRRPKEEREGEEKLSIRLARKALRVVLYIMVLRSQGPPTEVKIGKSGKWHSWGQKMPFWGSPFKPFKGDHQKGIFWPQKCHFPDFPILTSVGGPWDRNNGTNNLQGYSKSMLTVLVVLPSSDRSGLAPPISNSQLPPLTCVSCMQLRPCRHWSLQTQSHGPKEFAPNLSQKRLLARTLCRNVSGIFVVSILEDLAGAFPGGFFWALFPTKMRIKNPATKSAKKIRRPKNKNPRKICSAKIRPQRLVWRGFGENLRKVWRPEVAKPIPHKPQFC